MRFSWIFGVIAGGGLTGLGLRINHIAVGAMHEATAAILVAGGVIAIATGLLTQAITGLREDMRSREIRRMINAGEGGEIWKER